MRFLRTLSGLLPAALMVPAAVAQWEEPPPAQAEIAYVSDYVFRGVERAGSSAQVGLALNRENFRGRLWASQPFDQDHVRELNVRAAYVWPATETFSLEASIAHSWFGNVSGSGVEASFEAGVAASLASVGGFKPTLALYHDFRFGADTVQVSASHSVPLAKLGAFLELDFFAGWADGDNWRPDAPGPRRQDGYGYWGGEVRLPYRIGGHSTVTAGVHYSDSFQRSVTNGPFGRSAGDNLGFTIGVNLDF